MLDVDGEIRALPLCVDRITREEPRSVLLMPEAWGKTAPGAADTPQDAILETAGALDAGTIAMGTYGTRGIREIFGSCTRRVACRSGAAVPVPLTSGHERQLSPSAASGCPVRCPVDGLGHPALDVRVERVR